MSRLTKLNLDGNEIGDEGLKHIIYSPFLRKLEHLSIFDCGVERQGILYMTESSVIQNLSSLELEVNCDSINTLYRVNYLKGLKFGQTLSVIQWVHK